MYILKKSGDGLKFFIAQIYKVFLKQNVNPAANSCEWRVFSLAT